MLKFDCLPDFKIICVNDYGCLAEPFSQVLVERIFRNQSLRWKKAQEEIEIKAAHKRTLETYGPERLQSDLVLHGTHVGVHRIKRIRREHGIHCKQVKKFKATTNSNDTLPVATNDLEQNFEAEASNQAWVTDLTYILTAEGWVYLAGHKDLFTGEIVGYALGERMTKKQSVNVFFVPWLPNVRQRA